MITSLRMCGGSSEKIKIFISTILLLYYYYITTILLYIRCLALYNYYRKENVLIMMVVRGDLAGKTNNKRYIFISESVPFIILCYKLKLLAFWFL